MGFLYKHVLVIGATSGIGKGISDRLIAEGVKVTVVGRRKDRLDEFVSTHGPSKASSIVLDITNLSEIPAFAENVAKQYPTVDAIFLNAGTQGRYDFSQPASVDLPRFYNEIQTNFTSFVALTHAFLPSLLKHSSPTALIYTGTHLSLVPAFAMPAYSASKAALDAFIVCIREQLRDTNVGVIHISPPAVQTELHDFEMGEERGRKFGMPLEQFVDEAWEGLNSGESDLYIATLGGSTKEQFLEVAQKRKEMTERLSTLLRSFQ